MSARRPDLLIVNKRKITCKIMDFNVLADHRVKLKESEKKDKYLDLIRELKKTTEHESDDDTNCNWCSCYNHQRIGRGDLEIRGRVETIQTTALLRSEKTPEAN